MTVVTTTTDTTRDVAPDITAAATALLTAAATGVPCAPVRAVLTSTDLAAGYAVQRRLTADRLGRGGRVVGRKVGLTSAAVQAQLGVDTPDVGMLFADMRREQDEVIGFEGLLQPRIEAEIAFVVGADLLGDTSPEAVRGAVTDVFPAFEIVDSRIAGWDITLVDTVADNASSGLFVLGPAFGPLADLDLRPLTMTMTDHTGALVSQGKGAACLGDPVLALSWLATTLRDLGDPIRAGEIVLSGALGPMVPVTPGSSFTATIEALGSVGARFAPAPEMVRP